MNKENQVRFEMIDRICNFLRLHSPIWSATTRVRERLDELVVIRDSIQAANEAFISGDTCPDTQAEGAARYRAAELVLRVAHPVLEWALNQDNKSLEMLVNYSSSDLLQPRQAEAIERMNRLYAVCEAEVPNIPGCALTGEDMQAAREAIDAYVALKSGKSQKRTFRKAARLNIEMYLKQALRVLKQLDLLMLHYEHTHPDFYQEYELTRKVHNTGGPKKKRKPKTKPLDVPQTPNQELNRSKTPRKPDPEPGAGEGDTDQRGDA